MNKRITYTAEELRLMRETGVVSPKVPEADFRLLVLMSEMTGANILLNQIHTVPRWDSEQGKMVYRPQLSVHGLSLDAHRNRDFAGVDPCQYVYDQDGKLVSASVTIYRMVQGHRVAFTGDAYLEEYIQTNKDGKPIGLWPTKPRRMLQKCAYSNAVRMAYQEETGGLYIDEEMPMVESDPAALKERLGELGHQLHLSEEEFRLFLRSYEIDGKVALQAAVNALEQMVEEKREQSLIHLHAALAANPAD